MARKSYNKDLKPYLNDILHMLRDGFTITDIILKYDIPNSTFYRWVESYPLLKKTIEDGKSQYEDVKRGLASRALIDGLIGGYKTDTTVITNEDGTQKISERTYYIKPDSRLAFDIQKATDPEQNDVIRYKQLQNQIKELEAKIDNENNNSEAEKLAKLINNTIESNNKDNSEEDLENNYNEDDLQI